VPHPKKLVAHLRRARLRLFHWSLSVPVTLAVVLPGFGGCSSSRSSTSQSAATLDVPQVSNTSCAQSLSGSYDSPESTFRHYAEAVNQGNWCEAAAAFEASARVDLVVANFKAMTLLAGAANPRREAYQRSLIDFCSRHVLPCAEPKWAEQAAADLMTRTELAPKLEMFLELVRANPAQYYKELMTLMSAVDSGVLAKFDPVLSDVRTDDKKASGSAKQADGRVSLFNFINVGSGWMLTVR